jgi:hypothetical protein
MFSLPPGSCGLVLGLSAGSGVGLASHLRIGRGPFNLNPQGQSGAFDPILTRYIRLAEYVIGLSTGSIVLLVGSSALHGQAGRLPWFYASPLLVLAFSVIYAISFMVWLIFHYEEHQHGEPHTRFAYCLSLTLGFSGLICFLLGYVWLIVAVTR